MCRSRLCNFFARRAAIFLAVAALSAAMFPRCALAEGRAPDSGRETSLDQAHETVSSVLLNSAEWLDRFFRSDTYEDQKNVTRLKLKLDTFGEDGRGFDAEARFDLRISLPATENRLNLIFGTDPEDDPDADTPREEMAETESDFNAALEYFFMDKERQHLKLVGGVRWRDSHVVGFMGPRHRILWDLDGWDLRVENRLRWFTDEGWDYRLRFDFERPLGEALFLRLRPELCWYESKEGYGYNAGAFLFQPLSKKRALEYQLNTFFESDPRHQLKEIQIRLRFRQRIWREWLALEVAPQVTWYATEDYDTTPGILVRLEGWFGHWQN